ELDVNEPVISCIGYQALTAWIAGRPKESYLCGGRAIAKATQLRHAHTLVVTELILAMLSQFSRDYDGAERHAAQIVTLCVDHDIRLWRRAGDILGAWSRAMAARKSQPFCDIIERSMAAWTRGGARLFMPYWYGLLA